MHRQYGRCARWPNQPTLLTADHGFTYGPGLGSETRGKQRLDGRHRCVEIAGKPATEDIEDNSIVFLEKARLSLSKSYLAAVRRHFGRDTVSGWVMSHGGLLLQEVIIPTVAPHPCPSPESERIERYQSPRSKQPVERTVEQAEFEDMF